MIEMGLVWITGKAFPRGVVQWGVLQLVTLVHIKPIINEPDQPQERGNACRQVGEWVDSGAAAVAVVVSVVSGYCMGSG
jgi:hypothetical protein